MPFLFRAAPLFAAVLLAGCSLGPTSDVATGPLVALPGPGATGPAITPASVPASSTPTTTVTDAAIFVDATAFGLMTTRDKNEAASAQFNALRFGRAGAPRSWSGDKGTSGQVTVGPFVQANALVCRNFTHTVTVAGTSYSRQGTACQESDGSWSVTG